ncbi:MAG: hypothetical protein PHS93_09680 [Candidatus Omnitrophica bacterium]|nr:hypothetical protein [Candidatus Omnitrophota bacterium]
MDKGMMMTYTRKSNGVDSAIPQSLFDNLLKAGFAHDDILFDLAYDYQEKNWGVPIILSLVFFRMLSEKNIQVKSKKDGDKWEVSIMDLVQTLLENPKSVEILV